MRERIERAEEEPAAPATKATPKGRHRSRTKHTVKSGDAAGPF